MANTENMEADFPVTCIRVCLDETEPEYKGFICGITLENTIAFTNKEELLRGIGRAYRLIGQPQPVLVPRSFKEDSDQYNSYVGNPLRYHTPREIHGSHGKKETYDLTMLSKKHAEWQGVWRYSDGREKGRFYTMLECISQI